MRRRATSTTTRSRSASSSSRSCRRGCPRRRCGATARSIIPKTFNYPAFTIEATTERAGAGQVDQRPRRRQTATSCPICCRSTRRCTGRTRRAATPGGTAVPSSSRRPGRTRGPVPIVTHLHGGHSERGERRLPGGLVPADGEQHPARATRRSAPSTTIFRAKFERALASGVGAGNGGVPVRQRPARLDAVVPRPHARDDPGQRLRRTGRLLPAARRAQRRCAERRAARPGAGGSATCRDRRTTRSRSSSRTARSTLTARCSTRPAARSSTTSPGPYIPRAATSRRSGTRSSSATRSSSTARPGPSSRSSRAATASAS